MSLRQVFDLQGRVVVITGGAGMLGRQHALAIGEMGGEPILLDISRGALALAREELSQRLGRPVSAHEVDITSPEAVEAARDAILARYGRIDGLVNNAANNPKVEDGQVNWSRMESFPIEIWNGDIAVGLTGAFLCARVFGAEMSRRGGGSIVNIASDLALIAPDQRLYRKPGLADENQPVKPVTYSVVKAGLVGLTRYLATYWADRGVRANALCPGGVEAGQDPAFMARLHDLIPMGRMARADEYQGVLVFLLSDASSYMTGAVISIDGGRTAW